VTAPIRDLLRLDGEGLLIEFGPHREAILALFAIEPDGHSTACGSGWFADLAVVDDRLRLEALHLYGGRVTVAGPGRGVSAGGSPLAIGAFIGTADVTLPAPESAPGGAFGVISYVGIGAPLRCSGPLMVGRHPAGGRQAMALIDRQRLELDDGRVRR
jgi:hypothetical protein